MTELHTEVYDFIDENGPVRHEDIVDGVDAPTSEVKSALTVLIDVQRVTTTINWEYDTI